MDIEQIKRDNLSRIMAERGMRNRDLAALMRRDEAYVSMLLHGKRNIGRRTMALLESVGIMTADLFKQHQAPPISGSSGIAPKKGRKGLTRTKEFKALLLAYSVYHSASDNSAGQRIIRLQVQSLLELVKEYCAIEESKGLSEPARGGLSNRKKLRRNKKATAKSSFEPGN
jgi:hypothetical protein